MRRGHSIPLPRWTDKHGWKGGDSHRLFTFTDKLTGHMTVHPGNSGLRPPYLRIPVGPNATVRSATRAEAEALWQSPLHAGWKVAE